MRWCTLLLLLLGATQASAEVVTQSFSFEAGDFYCGTYPPPCPDIPEAVPPENYVSGSFRVTYDNDDFGIYRGPVEALDLTINGYTYDTSEVAFEFRGSCSDMYAGTCNPFGPSYGIKFVGGLLRGENSFSFGFSGPHDPNAVWVAGSFWYSVAGATYGWSTNWSSFNTGPDYVPGYATVELEATYIRVGLNVGPWDNQNRVYPDTNSIINVGLISSSIANGDPIDFDANQVYTNSLRLGSAEASAVSIFRQVDFNSDGLPDMMAGFDTADTGITCADTEVTLTAKGPGGAAFIGTDSIQTEDCATSGCHP